MRMMIRSKKSLLFFVMIFVLGVWGTIYAEELKASTTDIKIYLNGVLRNEQAVIINGSSYLPVKQVSNMLGFGVDYNDSLRQIQITTNYSGSTDTNRQNFATGSYIGTVKFTYDNGTVYTGGYKNGKFHGKGKIIYANGTIYEGNFVEGNLHGEGKYTAANGDIYKGAFVYNNFKGYGIYTYANGDIISSEFDGNQTKSVVYVRYKATSLEETLNSWDQPIQRVDVYDASFNATLYNGTADIIYSNGISYKGSVSYNKYNGKGKIQFLDGSVYDGYWVKDLKNGKGIYTYANGEVYDGYFVNDQFEGLGKYTYSNGDTFNGQWKANKRHGQGVYTYANGNKFEGAWIDDERDTIGYKGGYKGFETDFGKYTVIRKNIYNSGTEYRKTRDQVTYQKWDDGKLITER